MITNFEEHTTPLTTEETLLMKSIAILLQNEARKGKEITNRQIEEQFTAFNYQSGSARIRKIINAIRISGIVPRLLANSRGYYVSWDANEINKYLLSLHQRANAILKVAGSIEEQKKEFLKPKTNTNNQIDLFNYECQPECIILSRGATARP